MTDFVPFLSGYRASPDVQDAVVSLARKDSELNAQVPKSLRAPLMDLLKQVNSFYSNKIEGNPTLPADVLKVNFEGTSKKDAELEIKRHIEVQNTLNNKEVSESEISSVDFLKVIHRDFYAEMPEKFLFVENPDTGEKTEVIPGEFRTRGVQVGTHRPPEPEEIAGYMDWFARSYNLNHIHGLDPILAAAGSHHRFMHIHPFQDGNGRVGRLFTDCFMRRAGLGGYGFWTISRGFGRYKEGYYQALARADQPNRGGAWGGILSGTGLAEFTEYFIDTAFDQASYFCALLEPSMLKGRVDAYFEMRKNNAYVSFDGSPLPRLRAESRLVYRELMEHESLMRSDIERKIGMSDRTLRPILKQMAEEGLIEAPARKPVKLALSPNSIGFLFPHLW